MNKKRRGGKGVNKKKWKVLCKKIGCLECNETWYDYEKPACECVEVTA